MSSEHKDQNHLLALEFTRYGACYQLMNQIVPEDGVEVFEVSPTPLGGILILLAEKKSVLQKLLQTVNQDFKSMILDFVFIDEINRDVLNTYLSQNNPEIKDDLFFYEIDGVCKAFRKAQDIKTKGGDLIDFRVLRSINHRCIIISDRSIELGDTDHKYVQVSKPNKLVRSYFQI